MLEEQADADEDATDHESAFEAGMGWTKRTACAYSVRSRVFGEYAGAAPANGGRSSMDGYICTNSRCLMTWHSTPICPISEPSQTFSPYASPAATTRILEMRQSGAFKTRNWFSISRTPGAPAGPGYGWLLVLVPIALLWLLAMLALLLRW
ncbi:hypothetical protein [Nocardia terpenica]|uniref:hypothetical protein n=1 Tax=Nocardia terpenica TaxID=455432 RepID=UPI001E502B8B|nr:hypothetical protein [Nocardia terpenica]